MKIIAAMLIAGLVAQDSQIDSSRKVRDKLATMRITLDFKEARLDEMIAYFQEYSGLNFHLDADARTKEADGPRITLKLKDVTLKTALKLILNPRDLGCVYRDGIIVIATHAGLGTQTVTRIYDVRDILFRIQDFPGPAIGLKENEPGIVFVPLEEPKAILNEESLLDLIKVSTGDRAWEDSSASIQQINGLLVITQTKALHDEVRRFLELLNQYK